jgi:UDP-N-acetylmuramate dehydrogenase
MSFSIKNDYSLLHHNTFGMNVQARHFVEYDSIDSLREFLAAHRNERLLHIGVGSNLLFTNNFDGYVLHSNIKFCEKMSEDNDHVLMRVGSGVVWDDFCASMCAANLGGTENLSYIPGEVGASAVQNIGAYGAEVADIIYQVETTEIATGESRIFQNSECKYGYRQSIFKDELRGKYIVTAVVFRLAKKPTLRLDYGNLRGHLQHIAQSTIGDVRQAVISIRKQKLPEPSELGSAGSFFKNPIVTKTKANALLAENPAMPHYPAATGVKIPAAWLIEQCGWKGRTLGGAAVYEKQPLVLVNKNHATPADIQQLAQQIVDSIQEKFGIKIEPEVNYI